MKVSFTYFVAILFLLYSNVSNSQSTVVNGLQQNSGMCPLMKVEVIPSTSKDNQFIISYCNLGNSTATNAYLHLTVSAEVQITRSSISFATQPQGLHLFDLSDVRPNECSEFMIELPTGSVINQCINTHIFPDSPCQEMIDYYLDNFTTGNNGNSDDSDAGNSNNSTISETGARFVDFSNPNGFGNQNSVFEDNVILSNDPDSVSLIGNTTGGNTNGTSTSVTDRGFDISTISKFNYCSTQQVNNNTTNNSAQTHQSEINNSKNTEETDKLIDNKLSASIYPTPFNNFSTLYLSGEYEQNMQLQIIDINGRVIRTINTNKQQQITIGREKLNQGLYICRLYHNDTTIYTSKIVVH